MLRSYSWLKVLSSQTQQRVRAAPLFSALLLCGSTLIGAEARFTTVLDRSAVVLGETVTLTLKFEGGSPQGMPTIPQIPGMQIAPGISRSFNTSLGPDGAMTSVESYAVTLVPQQPGDFVIPALTAEVSGQKLQSQPLTLKVARSDPSAPPPELAEKLAFLWLIVPKQELFVGEVLIAEMRLYLRADVRNISDTQIPPLGGDGFSSSKFIEGQRFQRRVGNAAFTIIPLQVALTPLKTGTLTLGPLNGSLVVHVAATRARPRDPFDLESFFGPQTEPRRVELALSQQEVRVLPLPAQNKPANFNGAVGNYTMNFSAGPTNVGAGDPITLKIQISGRGHLEALTIPEPRSDLQRDFKLYPPTSRTETRDQLGIEGARFFEQLVVPQTAEVKELPAMSFSFFDPEQKTYRTLTQPAVPLVVRPSGSAPAPTIVSADKGAKEATPAQDIVHIKPRLGAVAQIEVPLIQQRWFLALQAAPVLALVASIVWRKRAEMLANNPKLRRQRQVAQIIREGLSTLRSTATEDGQELRQLANQKKSDEFFATLFRLLQEQLGERLDLPATAITEAVIEEHLRPLGVPEKTLAPLHELFQTCNLARYAPIKTSQELAAIIPKLEMVLGELREIMV